MPVRTGRTGRTATAARVDIPQYLVGVDTPAGRTRAPQRRWRCGVREREALVEGVRALLPPEGLLRCSPRDLRIGRMNRTEMWYRVVRR